MKLALSNYASSDADDFYVSDVRASLTSAFAEMAARHGWAPLAKDEEP